LFFIFLILFEESKAEALLRQLVYSIKWQAFCQALFTIFFCLNSREIVHFSNYFPFPRQLVYNSIQPFLCQQLFVNFSIFFTVFS